MLNAIIAGNSGGIIVTGMSVSSLSVIANRFVLLRHYTLGKLPLVLCPRNSCLSKSVARFSIGLSAIMAFSSCSDRNVESIVIDGHVFEVPQEYLIEERIPWLPQSKTKGLLFLMNPEAPVREGISVLIESRRITCRQGDASEQLARYCLNESDRVDTDPINWERVKRIQPAGNPTQWSYVYEEPEKTVVTIASCFAMADGKSGLCTVLGSYNNLVYTLRVQDSEVARIPQIKLTVSKLLSAWTKKARSFR